MVDYMPQRTIRYKTYLKNTIVAALDDVFKNHVDEGLRGTKTTIEYPRTEVDYPAVVIRFFERDLKNAGVGHTEVLTVEDGRNFKFRHYFYNGDIEFAIFALSSYDRDLVSDSVVQTIIMGGLQAYTNRFFNHIYPETAWQDLHFVAINSDNVQGFGESQQRADWGAEDEIIYKTSYRISVFGELYSLPPDVPFEYIQRVIIYPYIGGLDPLPEGRSDNATAWEP